VVQLGSLARGGKAHVSLVTLQPHGACFYFWFRVWELLEGVKQLISGWVRGHAQFLGGCPLEDSGSLLRGTNKIVVMCGSPGLEIPSCCDIH
jgi:hypothetical protein